MPEIKLSREEEADAISKDINHVIRAKTSEIAVELALEDDMAQAFLDRLLLVQHRTYLWVTLVFDEIRRALRKSKKSLVGLINKLPQTVSDAYEALLQRVVDKEEATKVLHIILATQRPISVKELDVALALEPSSRSYSNLDLEGESARKEYVRCLCGLVIIVFEGKLYFIHETARDFLIKKQPDLGNPQENRVETFASVTRFTQGACPSVHNPSALRRLQSGSSENLLAKRLIRTIMDAAFSVLGNERLHSWMDK